MAFSFTGKKSLTIVIAATYTAQLPIACAKRKAYDESPVVVDYEITSYCKSFDPIIKPMIHWGREHRKFITGKQTSIVLVEGDTNEASAGTSTTPDSTVNCTKAPNATPRERELKK